MSWFVKIPVILWYANVSLKIGSLFVQEMLSERNCADINEFASILEQMWMQIAVYHKKFFPNKESDTKDLTACIFCLQGRYQLFNSCSSLGIPSGNFIVFNELFANPHNSAFAPARMFKQLLSTKTANILGTQARKQRMFILAWKYLIQQNIYVQILLDRRKHASV